VLKKEKETKGAGRERSCEGKGEKGKQREKESRLVRLGTGSLRSSNESHERNNERNSLD